MNDITVADYLVFFRGLDLKRKVEVLKELTNELNEVVEKSTDSNNEDQLN